MTVYATRYQARKNKRGDEVTVKVDGGFAIMSVYDYQIWKKQK